MLLTEKITAKLVKEGVSDAVTAGSKVRAAVVNPTPAQLATAEKLGVDPRWVKSDGSPDWPTKANNGFDGGLMGRRRLLNFSPARRLIDMVAALMRKVILLIKGNLLRRKTCHLNNVLCLTLVLNHHIKSMKL